MTIQTMITDTTDLEYDYLLMNWDRNVSNFKSWLQIVCGIKKESGLFQLIDEEIQSENDLQMWIQVWDGDLDEIETVTDLYMSRLIH
jgi:hypothetical protein